MSSDEELPTPSPDRLSDRLRVRQTAQSLLHKAYYPFTQPRWGALGELQNYYTFCVHPKSGMRLSTLPLVQNELAYRSLSLFNRNTAGRSPCANFPPSAAAAAAAPSNVKPNRVLRR